jgi:hypothetical protein
MLKSVFRRTGSAQRIWIPLCKTASKFVKELGFEVSDETAQVVSTEIVKAEDQLGNLIG